MWISCNCLNRWRRIWCTRIVGNGLNHRKSQTLLHHRIWERRAHLQPISNARMSFFSKNAEPWMQRITEHYNTFEQWESQSNWFHKTLLNLLIFSCILVYSKWIEFFICIIYHWLFSQQQQKPPLLLQHIKNKRQIYWRHTDIHKIIEPQNKQFYICTQCQQNPTIIHKFEVNDVQHS